jgi:hypothetical protein
MSSGSIWQPKKPDFEGIDHENRTCTNFNHEMPSQAANLRTLN